MDSKKEKNNQMASDIPFHSGVCSGQCYIWKALQTLLHNNYMEKVVFFK